MTTRSFPLVPMSGPIRALTIALWLLPVVFLALALQSASDAARFVLLAVLALYAAVFLFCRPARFEVSVRSLDVVFPAWRRTIPAPGIAGAREITGGQFRQEFGWGLRIGVGGLWGGFGWLWTPAASWSSTCRGRTGWSSSSAVRPCLSC